MANIFEFLSKDGIITPEKARKLRQMQFCDKTACVWGLCYRWDPSLSMSHFKPLCLVVFWNSCWELVFFLCHFRCFAIFCYLPRSFPTSRSSPRSGLNRAKGRSTWRKVVSQVGSWTRSSRWSINNATSSLSTTLAILVMMIANWLTSLGTGCFEYFERLLTNSHSSKCLDLSQTTPGSQWLLLLLLLSLLTLVLLLFLSVSRSHRGNEQVGHLDSVGWNQRNLIHYQSNHNHSHLC